jgi:ubiquinone/menaquinone biosynthesis C-methylase UbiE
MNNAPDVPRTPSLDPHAERAKQAWQSPAEAAKYKKSRHLINHSRYRREEAIINGWLQLLPAGAQVLDTPCGTGRMISLITEKGFSYTGADISPAMIVEAKKEAGTNPRVVRFLQADLENLQFEDNSFDCVMIWRLFHHLADPRVRERMLSEAARVSRRWVFISFHHLLSFTAFRKTVMRTCFGRVQNGRPITHWRLAREAEHSGLRLVETQGLRKYVSINWFARLEKNPPR